MISSCDFNNDFMRHSFDSCARNNGKCHMFKKAQKVEPNGASSKERIPKKSLFFEEWEALEYFIEFFAFVNLIQI